MENKMLTELQGMLEDINPNEIVSHILDGTLLAWLDSWKMKCCMLVAFLLESDKANMAELEKLRRENFGLKTVPGVAMIHFNKVPGRAAVESSTTTIRGR